MIQIAILGERISKNMIYIVILGKSNSKPMSKLLIKNSPVDPREKQFEETIF